MASEVNVSSTQGLTRVVSEVAALLESQKEAKITAINMAIPSAVNLVELLKHRVKGLYQQNSFEKVPESNKTRVIFLLSLKPLDVNHKGYQAPLPESEVQEKSFAELQNPPSRSADDNADESRRRPRGNRGTRGTRGTRGNRGNRGGPRDRTETKGEGPSQTRTDLRPTGQNEERGRRGRRADRGSRAERGQRNDRRETAERGQMEEGGQRGVSGELRGRGQGLRGTRGGRRGGRGNFRNKEGRNREVGMEKYQLVRTRDESGRQKHEIFVSGLANPIFAIKDGLRLFKKDGLSTIVIKASGRALAKAAKVAEEIRKKEPGLHQINASSKKTIQDRYKPLEEGLDEVVKDRVIDGLEITLSKNPLDKTHSGYQPPLPADKVINMSLDEVEKL